METRTRGRYSRTLGLQLLQQLMGEGRYVFSNEEARPVAEQLDISEGHLIPLLFRLAEAGWRCVLENFTVQKYTAETIQLYRKVIGP